MTTPPSSNGSAKKYKTVSQQIDEATPALLDLYHAVADHLQAAGDDVQVKTTDFYIAFRRLKNFACVELRNQLGKVLSYVRIDPATLEMEPGFTRDMRDINHFGTGDLEITIQSMADLEKAKPLFDAAYQNGWSGGPLLTWFDPEAVIADCRWPSRNQTLVHMLLSDSQWLAVGSSATS